jgi:hypothetical protein
MRAWFCSKDESKIVAPRLREWLAFCERIPEHFSQYATNSFSLKPIYRPSHEEMFC